MAGMIKKKAETLVRYLVALHTLKNCKKRESQCGKVKVVFLVQYVPSWNKINLLYENMVTDPRVDPYIVCIPMEKNHEEISFSKFTGNETYDYFVSRGYQAVNALREDGGWFDLRELSPDYVFYTRPYNIFLPAEYQSSTVAGFSRICLVLYGMTLSSIGNSVMNRDFFQYVSCYFAEDEEAKEMFENKFFPGIRCGLQKAVTLGVPVLESVYRHRQEKTDIWNFGKSGRNVLWLPRWSTDRKDGGSNFFKYKNELLAYYAENENKLLIRPHPLMFSNFIKTGEWTKEECDAFQETCGRIGNIKLDTSNSYTATLWATDILIADITSMIAEFFLTGKPIIYCCPDAEITYTKLMYEMLSYCYVVRSQDELFGILQQLERGSDPLKAVRERFAGRLVHDYADGCVGRITEEVAQRNV